MCNLKSCPKCSKEIGDKALFCGSCGWKPESKTNENNEISKIETYAKEGIPTVLRMIAFIFLLLGIGYGLFNNNFLVIPSTVIVCTVFFWMADVLIQLRKIANPNK